MTAWRTIWRAALCVAALSCGGEKTAQPTAASKRALQAPLRVLVLKDADTSGTTGLVSALSAAGNQVTEWQRPDYNWDGVTPALHDFDCVVDLNSDPSVALGDAAQQALEAWVHDGGGFVAAQWNGFEYANAMLNSMPDLSLQGYGGISNNCSGCSMTWTPQFDQVDHPVLAGIPSPIVFQAEGHDAGAQHSFADQPSSVLMRAPRGGPAVLAREFGIGHVVQFSLVPNMIDGASLLDANIQKLYANAVSWAGHPAKPPVVPPVANAGADQTVQATGPMTPVLLDGSASTPPDATYTWLEGDVVLASTAVAAVQLTVGTHTLQLLITNEAGGATAFVTVTVVAVAAPELVLPPDMVAEATGPTGATADFTTSASDPVDGTLPTTCDHASGSVFALGTTVVTCSASAPNGNTATGSFSVTVQDTKPPALLVPGDLSAIASSLSGATVTYTASSSDLVNGAVAPSCAPASGSVFAPGMTTVRCSATDASGNSSPPASFHVQVQFAWSGLLDPVHADGSSVFDDRAIVPVRFRLTDASARIANLAAHLFVAPVVNGVPGTPEPAGAWTLDHGRLVRANLFTFVAGNYVLLTPLRGLSAGRYAFIVDLGDGVKRMTGFTVSTHRGRSGGHDGDSAPDAIVSGN